MTPEQRPQQPMCGLRRRLDPLCDGPAEVQIRDQVGTTAWGCITHAASALACIRGSKIVAHTRDAAAIEAHTRAEAIKTERGWARPYDDDDAAVRPRTPRGCEAVDPD